MLMIEKMATRYFAGTASVQAGGTIVTPHGALWAGNIWGDDLFFLPSQPMVPPQRIEQINEDGTAQLAYPWPGVDAVEAEYEIRYVGMIERSTAQSRRVLEQLGDVKSWADVFVATDADRLALETPTNPLRAGFRVLVTEDGLIWAKASGAYDDWLPPAEFKGDKGDKGNTGDRGPIGVNWRGAYNPGTAYAPHDAVLHNGSSWRAKVATTGNPPPSLPATENTQWVLLARAGVDGTIDGVTPFWVSRLGSDTDAAAARLGLGAASLEGNIFTGVQRMPSTSRIFGTAAYLSFENNTSGTRTGFVGNGSGGNDDIYLFSDVANIRLIPASGFNVLASGSRILNLAAGIAASDAANVGQIPSIIRSNTVGTVSQSGGVPTGAIVERGGNANGEYVRFADGTQICWGTVSIPGVSTPTGSLFMSVNVPVTFPAAFVGSVSGAASVYAAGLWASLHDPAPTGAVFRAYCGVSLSASQGGRYIATGRWF